MLPKTYIKDAIEIAERYAGEDRFGTNVRVLIDFLKTGVIEHHDIFKFFEETDLSRNLDSKKVFSDIYATRQ
jgi:hypothetical protein